ncbi:hypothetical protein MVEN_00951800 [Mycena venus]|uniref:Uncharacterized protein n=1 Tax=Mycena venus TaxID=2733690 RepID=A0A8H6YBZ8_9AGAR|nr:hypothetical protein MVEN_00951800 [Mycena venus]
MTRARSPRLDVLASAREDAAQPFFPRTSPSVFGLETDVAINQPSVDTLRCQWSLVLALRSVNAIPTFTALLLAATLHILVVVNANCVPAFSSASMHNRPIEGIMPS